MNNTFKEIAEKLYGAQNILLFPHVGIDGDAIGSCVALACALRKLNKNVFALYKDELPENLAFMFYDENGMNFFTENADEISDNDLDISMAVDCGGYDRFKDFRDKFDKAKSTICVDHHGTSIIKEEDGNTHGIADLNHIDPDAAACGELVFEILLELEKLAEVKSNADVVNKNSDDFSDHFSNKNMQKGRGLAGLFSGEITERNTDKNAVLFPDKLIANSLFAAITTDTGNFQYSNTSAHTHMVVSKLYDWGLEANKVSVEIYESDRLEALKIRSLAMGRMKIVANGRAAFTYVSKDEMESIGVKAGETDAIVNMMRVVKPIEYVAFLKEKEPNVIRVSFRAKALGNVVDIATKYNGGGHIKAAGCTLNMPLIEAIELIRKELEEAVEKL